MKNKPYEWVSENAKKNRKFTRRLGALLLLILFALTCIPLPFSLFGRKSLHKDYSVSRYNAINREVVHYDAEDVRTVTIDTFWSRNGVRSVTGSWNVKIVLTMADDEKFVFHNSHFSGEDGLEVRFWLSEMIKMRESFSAGQIVVKGTERLNFVIDDKDLNDQEAVLLYELFAQP